MLLVRACVVQAHWALSQAHPAAFSVTERMAAATAGVERATRLFDSIIIIRLPDDIIRGPKQFFNMGFSLSP